MPQLSLLTSVIMDGFSIAVVSYTITLSMGLIFAQKLDYELDANQELLALVSLGDKKIYTILKIILLGFW